MFKAMQNLQAFCRAPLQFVTDLHATLGGFVTLNLAHKKFHFIADPDLCEEVLSRQTHAFKKSRLIFNKIKPITGERGLVQLEEASWSELRQVTNRLFARELMASYPAIINAYVDEVCVTLTQYALNSQPFDIVPLMLQYTINTAIKIIFGIDDDEKTKRIAQQFVELNRLCGLRMRSILSLPLCVPTRSNRQILKLQKNLRALVRDLMLRNKTSDTTHLLSILMHQYPHDELLVHDQLMTFLFAGYETTAASLAFCLHLLAAHPEAQNKIRREAHKANDVKHLLFTQAVYREALRLYPPAWILAREVTQTITLRGTKLRRGENVILSVRELHRHHTWKDSEQFNPERFLKNSPPKFSYIPFGKGQRICSGHQFAMLEATIALAKLCQRFEFIPASESKLELDAMVTLHPHTPIYLRCFYA